MADRSRSSRRTGLKQGPRSLSATSVGTARKHPKSTHSVRGKQGYSKVNEADEIEMADLAELELQAAQLPCYKSSDVKPHEIYQNTQYIPNTALRLLDVPMSSSLAFQKLLWFHGTFDWVYIILMIGGQLNRVQTRDKLPVGAAILVVQLIWIPIEVFRLRSGYQGNIKETFPDLILFLGLTICILILNCVPLITFKQRYPHELSCVIINLLFTVFELIFGFAVGLRFIKSHFASFKLRTAPIIDRNFAAKYQKTNDIMGKREIELGTQRFDEQHDRVNPFDESDRFNKAKTR